jgi:2-desacetyl-2-hydroxyethyl bacteriochlorophyllide A dehydrogenase
VDKILLIEAPGKIRFDKYEERAIEPGEVRVRTLYSGISAGTEMTIYRGSNPYAKKRWDAELKLFLNAEDDPRMYPTPVGYEEVGRVEEVGADVAGVTAGDLIYGSWGHRTGIILPGRVAAANRMQPDADPRHGVFARIGAIALNGILDAQINVGEVVAVFGAGVVGLICCALARLSGATVIAVDVRESRLAHARPCADLFFHQDAAMQIKRYTKNRGADVVIEATGSDMALNEAIRSVAYSARVVSLGFYQNNAQGLYLGEEFHHNRISIVCSQIFAVNPALSYRWDVPRLERTIMELQHAGKLNLMPLITHEFPFERAAEAYRLLEEHPEETVQVVLRFADGPDEPAAKQQEERKSSDRREPALVPA